MLVIADYGVGNLFSLKSSLAAIGAGATVSAKCEDIENADRIILPGVGAFGDAAKKLYESGIAEVLKKEAERGKPILGICLGMQLLFEKSFEYGEYDGLGLIKGNVRPISEVIPKNYKIPHIGWNSLKFTGEAAPILKYIKDGDFVCFVHSFYAADCEENTVAVTEYGADLTAAVMRDNIFGCQFHPEKSGDAGLNILRAFCELK